jgi:hypothetical protein
MSEMQKLPPPPRVPAPSAEEHANFGAYAKWMARAQGISLPESELRQTRATDADGRITNVRVPPGANGIAKGMKKYSTIPVPALVIFAVPHSQAPWIQESSDPAVQEAAKKFAASEMPLVERQAKAIEDAVPTTRVVRIANANHVIFISNEADVLREMQAFLKGLGKDWR